MMITYQLLQQEARRMDGTVYPVDYIQCLNCGTKSFHPEDIRQRFCGTCAIFHEDLARTLSYLSQLHSQIPMNTNLEKIRQDCMKLFEQSVGYEFRVKGTPLKDFVAGVDYKYMHVVGRQFGNFHIDLVELTGKVITEKN
jgi:ribosomal protein L37E